MSEKKRRWFGKKNSGPDPAAEAAQHAQAAAAAAAAAAQELEQKRWAWRQAIDRPTDRHLITVSSLKGGVTKTTTTLGLGTALALWRRNPVLAIDANPHRGNLSDRLGFPKPELTVRDLAYNADGVTSQSIFRRFALQAPTRLEVTSSEPDPENAQAFSPEEYRRAVEVACRFRDVIITDTGIDLNLPLMEEVYRVTETLVIPMTTADDAAQLAWETLDWWVQKGRADLAETAVVVITQALDFTHPKDVILPPEEIARRQYEFSINEVNRMMQLGDIFGRRLPHGSVSFVPRDPALATGGLFDWGALQQQTRDAYEQIAAAVAARFRPPVQAVYRDHPHHQQY